MYIISVINTTHNNWRHRSLQIINSQFWVEHWKNLFSRVLERRRRQKEKNTTIKKIKMKHICVVDKWVSERETIWVDEEEEELKNIKNCRLF